MTQEQGQLAAFLQLWQEGLAAERTNNTKLVVESYKRGCELAIKFLEKDTNQKRKQLIKRKVSEIIGRVETIQNAERLKQAPALPSFELDDCLAEVAGVQQNEADAVTPIGPPLKVFNEYEGILYLDLDRRLKRLEDRVKQHIQSANTRMEDMQQKLDLIHQMLSERQ